MDAVIMRIIQQDLAIAKEIASNQELGALDKIIKFLFTQSVQQDSQKQKMLEQFPKVENALMRQRALESSLKIICPVLAEIIEEGNQLHEFNVPFPIESIQFLVAGIQSLNSQPLIEAETPESIERKLTSFIEIIYRVLGINEQMYSKESISKKFKMILGS